MLTPTERKRQGYIHELIVTEENYVNDLQLVTEVTVAVGTFLLCGELLTVNHMGESYPREDSQVPIHGQLGVIPQRGRDHFCQGTAESVRSPMGGAHGLWIGSLGSAQRCGGSATKWLMPQSTSHRLPGPQGWHLKTAAVQPISQVAPPATYCP